MDIKSYMTRIGQQARKAASEMARADTDTKNRALRYIAEAIRRDVAQLRAANQKDLDIAAENGLEPALLKAVSGCKGAGDAESAHRFLPAPPRFQGT